MAERARGRRALLHAAAPARAIVDAGAARGVGRAERGRGRRVGFPRARERARRARPAVLDERDADARGA